MLPYVQNDKRILIFVILSAAEGSGCFPMFRMTKACSSTNMRAKRPAQP
jgi:hypothetical protein